jgi:tetratricopeptide (TPR) repeat protein
MNVVDRSRSTALRGLLAGCVVALACPSVVHGQAPDRVRLTTGVELQGKVVDMSPAGVDIENQAGVRKVAIESVREVRFGGEPDSLRNARGMLLRQDFAGAAEELGKVEPAELDGADPMVLTEMAFVKTAAAARRALATGSDLEAAQKAVAAFLAAHPRSHHLHAVQELAGGVLARMGRFDDAAAAYAGLTKGPPVVQGRAAILTADLLFAQQRFADALRDYDSAARVDGRPPAGDAPDDGKGDAVEKAVATARNTAAAAVERDARLGRARCLAKLGKTGDAIEVVRGLLQAVAPADGEALGRAYNVLGEVQRASGDKDRDALISFLTVDLVHNSVPDEHAEALFNLVELWEKTDNPERSREARRMLETTYPESPWTKKLPPAKAS